MIDEKCELISKGTELTLCPNTMPILSDDVGLESKSSLNCPYNGKITGRYKRLLDSGAKYRMKNARSYD